MIQTRKKRASKNRGSRKNLLKNVIQGGAPPPKSLRDTKYATTMVKNVAPPKPPKSASTPSYAGICNEISNQTNKIGTSYFAKINSSSGTKK